LVKAVRSCDEEIVVFPWCARADSAAVAASLARQAEGAPSLAPETRGAAAVAEVFRGKAQAAQLALVDGAAGLVFAPGGQPRVVFNFIVEGGKIMEIGLIADPDDIRRLGVELGPA
jgi:RNA polymerase sigma-70 factor (ECF subfamily)